MKDVDGFTLIDYIKSSIEILMNMKMDDNDDESTTHVKQNKKKKKHNKENENEEADKYIPKIDDKTPTSSIKDL